MTPAIFHLVMHAGPTVGSSYDLVDEEITIGRETYNTIVINDVEVSRKHVHLTLQAGKYLIEDLGSLNGTFINGRRLSGPHVMRPGEKITLGANVILVFEEAPADASATVATPILPVEQAVIPLVSPPPQPGIPAQPPPSSEATILPLEMPVKETPAAEPMQVPTVVPVQPTPSPQPTYTPPVRPSRSVTPPSRQAGPVMAQPIVDEPGVKTPAVSRARPVSEPSGTVEAEPVEEEEPAQAFDTRWLLLGCAGLLLVACLAITAFMFWVDAGGEARWCQFFSFVPFFICPP
jgi:pSer/pThr/pTyr-binding forkhead associated (FHA) protein